QRLAWIAVGHVLVDRILDVLPAQRVLQLGREDRDAVDEKAEVEAVLVGRAIAELAGDGEEVRRGRAPRLLVEPARGPEVGQPEFASRVLDAAPEDVQHAAPPDLRGEALEEP